MDFFEKTQYGCITIQIFFMKLPTQILANKKLTTFLMGKNPTPLLETKKSIINNKPTKNRIIT